MDLTLTVDDQLAADLRALAESRRLSIDEVGLQALRVGLECMTTPPVQLGTIDLGPLHTTPPTAEQILRMRSPIVARGPIPPLRMTIIDPPPAEQRNAH